MTQEEQDVILGRVVREHGECRRSLGLIDAELESFADELGELMRFVNQRVRFGGFPADKRPPKFPERVSKYIDPAKLLALLEEQDELLKRIKATALTLKSINPQMSGDR